MAFWASFLWLLVLHFIFLSDAPFLGDEAGLVNMALSYNTQGVWADHSFSTPNATYGPSVVWIYQLFFSLSKNLLLFGLLKTLISNAVIFALGGFLIFRLRVAPRATFLLVAASPYLWFYSRDYWDNSWLIPFSGGCALAYLYWWETGKRWAFAASALLAALALGTHLMTVSVLAVMGVHAAILRRDWLRKNRIFVVSALALAVVVLIPYLQFLWSHPSVAFGESRSLGGRLIKSLSGLGNGLLAPRYFQYVGFDYLASPLWWWPTSKPWPFRVLLAAGYFATFVGMFFFYRGVVSAFTRCRQLFQEQVSDTASAAISISLCALGLHVAVSAFKGLGDFPHYYTALWWCIFVLTAVGVGDWYKRAFWRNAYTAQIAGSIICLTYLVLHIRDTGGTRFNQWGPTVSNQIEVADAIAQYPRETPVVTDRFRTAPNVLALVALSQNKPSKTLAPTQQLVIEYSQPANTADSHIELRIETK